MALWHDSKCVCGPGVRRFGISCCDILDDPENLCPDNGDDEVAPLPMHICSATVPFTHREHKHLGNHRCQCGHEWGNDDDLPDIEVKPGSALDPLVVYRDRMGR